MKYAIVIEKLPRNYCAHVPDLPVCVSTGKTLDEVRRNIREAIALYLGAVRQKGMEPPRPHTRVEEFEIAEEVEIA